MKTEKKIRIAFVLNLLFAVFEFLGGIWTGSVAIVSDALHDLGDAASIGVSMILEKKSRKAPDAVYTYGYARYSVLGGLLTTVILLAGSVLVICNAIRRFAAPVPIHYDGMLVFAVVGMLVNLTAAFFTRHGDSLNQKAVNLHMLEDVLGWAVVLLGAVIMRFMNQQWIDPAMSIGVAVFILFHALGHLKEALEVLLDKIPDGISIAAVRQHIMALPEVEDVHHLHIWSLDGQRNYATMHLVTDADPHQVKHIVRRELEHLGICHATVETERRDEPCHDRVCQLSDPETLTCHHHHHHH